MMTQKDQDIWNAYRSKLVKEGVIVPEKKEEAKKAT